MPIRADLKIVLVGATAVQRKALRDLLSMSGFRNIQVAKDGPSAWEHITATKPGMIIAEWDMPEMSGIALLKLVRKDPELSETPVVLWTSGISKDDVLKAGEAGVNAILVEPYNLDYIETKMRLISEFELSPSTKQAKMHLDRGDMLLKEKRFDKALLEYSNVLKTLESAEVYYNIGYIKTAKGQFDEALVAFRKATQLDQMFAKAYKAMAEIYMQRGDNAMAEKYLQMAGEIFLEREMHDNAEAIFNEIVKLNPDTINVYNSLGIIYRRQNRIEDAVMQYRKALKIDPNDENIYFNLGRAYMDLNQKDLAKSCFADAVRINPHFDIARGLLDSLETSYRIE